MKFDNEFQTSDTLISPGSNFDKPKQRRSTFDLECLEEDLSQLDLADSSKKKEGATESADQDEVVPKRFDAAQCLFCNHHSAGLTENLSHMHKRHGLFIPSSESLIVDVETLVGYLHLVIFDYAECLYCGSVRNTPQAAQQHMTGKGHCRIDITREDSEFKDFYRLDLSSESKEAEGTGDSIVDRFVGVDKTRRLASGKLVAHRNTRKQRVYRPAARTAETQIGLQLEGGANSLVSEALSAVTLGGSRKKEVAAAEKRDLLFNKQLASLRPGDHQALMHLPLPQQRALVATAKRQQEKWNREKLAQEIKRQLKANP